MHAHEINVPRTVGNIPMCVQNWLSLRISLHNLQVLIPLKRQWIGRNPAIFSKQSTGRISKKLGDDSEGLIKVSVIYDFKIERKTIGKIHQVSFVFQVFLSSNLILWGPEICETFGDELWMQILAPKYCLWSRSYYQNSVTMGNEYLEDELLGWWCCGGFGRLIETLKTKQFEIKHNGDFERECEDRKFTDWRQSMLILKHGEVHQ